MKIKNSRLLDWKFLVSFVLVVGVIVGGLALMPMEVIMVVGLSLLCVGFIGAFINGLFVIIGKWMEIDRYGWYRD
jgi:undecaprenyl pyrophosphate phosphatase UppP